MNIEIHEDRSYELRDLGPGEHYISVPIFQRYGDNKVLNHVRVRTEDPFISKTVWGSKVAATPSKKVLKVSILYVK